MMLGSVDAKTTQATTGGSAQSQAVTQALAAPPANSLSQTFGNQSELRLRRKCDCGGGPDCDCDMGSDKKTKEKGSPRTGLHRKASEAADASPSLLDSGTQSFFEARVGRNEKHAGAPIHSGAGIRIGRVDDPLEREADRSADRVMRMAEPLPQLAGKLAGRGEDGLHRKAVGAEAEPEAPPIVHEVLRTAGEPLDAGTRSFFEARFGADLSQVRIHTDSHAHASADAVSAQAYTVGQHIAFAKGRFEPASASGRQLLAHELTHAVGAAPSAPAPSGNLRISNPAEPAERHAAAVSGGATVASEPKAVRPAVFRQPAAPAIITGVKLNHDKVTVPPEAGLSFNATKAPANAQGVTFALVGDNATIDAGTTIGKTTGGIKVAKTQTGGSAHVAADQNTTGPTGPITTASPATDSFNFVGIPGAITKSTATTPPTHPANYGGDFKHTFTSPGGGPAAIEDAHLNEQFAGAKGTPMTLKGVAADLNIDINDPASLTDGWDLDATGTMTTVDEVSWGKDVDARPFVKNASQPTPKTGMPLVWSATQNFRNLSFPSNKYGGTATSTTHRRAIEDRSNKLTAVTSAGVGKEIAEPYAGPTIFRHCKADPVSVPVAAPAPPAGKAPAAPGAPAAAPAAATSKISVEAEGQAATPSFSFNGPDLDCKIDAGGVLTPGTKTGTVTVRAGDSTNFDETKVTLTAATAAAPAAPPTSPPAAPPAAPPTQKP